MKKLLLLAIASTLSFSAWADCDDVQSTYEAQKCYSNEVSTLKNQLNKTYAKLYSQTEAKSALDDAQKAWLNYKEKQCGDFTYADAGASDGQIVYDLSCQVDLYKSRINYLREITSP